MVQYTKRVGAASKDVDDGRLAEVTNVRGAVCGTKAEAEDANRRRRVDTMRMVDVFR